MMDNDRYGVKQNITSAIFRLEPMTETDKKAQTRARILAGAGRTFRASGYGGAGVDALAKEAGVTSGAFYSYFKSKADAFREAVVLGMQDLERAVLDLQAADESGWRQRFIDFYLGERRTCAPTEACALQSLSGEVARADDVTRAAYEQTLRAVIAAATQGMPAATSRERRRDAIVMLALLSGAVSLARAVRDPELSLEIASAVRHALLGAAGSAKKPKKPG